MDRATALANLGDMVAATTRPVLDVAALGRLLDASAIPDPIGTSPEDTANWVPTWDLNRAAMEGWRRKAAAVAADFSFTADNASYSKGDVLANMERMVAMYAAKVSGSSGAPDVRLYDWTGLLP